MSDLVVDVAGVVALANNIKNVNNQIRDKFGDVQDAIVRLDNSWESPAATSSIGKFNEIKSEYCNARYKVVDNFVAFLHQQVGEGYTQTEDVNKTLADAFK